MPKTKQAADDSQSAASSTFDFQTILDNAGQRWSKEGEDGDWVVIEKRSYDKGRLAKEKHRLRKKANELLHTREHIMAAAHNHKNVVVKQENMQEAQSSIQETLEVQRSKKVVAKQEPQENMQEAHSSRPVKSRRAASQRGCEDQQDDLTGARGQVRCVDCYKLRGRINNAIRGCPDLKPFRELQGAERAQFYRRVEAGPGEGCELAQKRR